MSSQEIQEAILKHPSPFVTPKRIHQKFSSRTRPDQQTVQSQTLHLEKIGLGTVKQTERSDYFYKVLPSVMNGETLTNFGLSLEEYSRQFNKQDDGLTNSQKEAAVDNHPNGEAYDAYIASQNSQK